MSTNHGQYYRRFLCAFIKDVLRLWRAQVIGVLLAFAIVLLQIHYGLIPKTLTVQAVLSVGWPYAVLLFILIVIPLARTPFILDEKRQEEIGKLSTDSEVKLREQMETHASESDRLRAEIRSLRESTKLEKERQSKKFSFWLEVSKSDKPKPTIMRRSEYGEGSSVHADLPQTNIIVVNEGQLPLKVLGFTLWRGDGKGNPEGRDNHQIVVMPLKTVSLEALPVLMGVLSGPPQWDFSKIQGDHAITAAIQYEDEGEVKQSDPVKQYVRVSLSGTGVFNFEVSRLPFQAA